MKNYSEFLKQAEEKIAYWSKLASSSDVISSELYEKEKVFRGLRDINGNGVVCGLTEISEIISSKKDENGNKIPARGELYYRGYDVKDIIRGFVSDHRFGFEETVFLLLCGKLPAKGELEDFRKLLKGFRSLPDSFVRDVILKAPSRDMMNALSRCVLTLYAYDDKADDTSIENVFRQILQMIAQFPLLSVYGYKSFQHYHNGSNLVIRNPDPELSTAENILYMLHGAGRYTELDAMLLDLCLVLQAEHGGGNNSTFTTHVVTSSGTDTYSTVAAALGSLKGPRHGGANIKVVRMFDDIRENIPDYSDGAVRDYLVKILDKQAFDRTGLIYGIGHAVYSLSDPRVDVLRDFVQKLAETNDFGEEFVLYEKIERLAPEIIADRRKMYKGVSANVDFYTGFVYKLLRIPLELFTPMFAVSRIAGWGAHRLEEIANNGKIIRPAYNAVKERQTYRPMSERS